MSRTSFSLITQVEKSGVVYFHAKWRRRLPDGTNRQVKRAIGKAWLEVDDDGQVVARRGRVPAGYFDERGATIRAQEVMDAVEAEHAAALVASQAAPTVADLLARFIEHRETVKGLRPSTLRDYRNVLGSAAVTTIAQRPADEVTPKEISDVLAAVEKGGAAPRTVNKYRSILGAAWAWGARPTALSLTTNPVKLTDTRRQPARRTVDWYSIEEVEHLARHVSESDGWRAELRRQRKAKRDTKKGAAAVVLTKRPTRALKSTELVEARHHEQQDPELVRLAAYAGLRLSEVIALRWADVDFQRHAINVRSTISDGLEVDAPKSGKHRTVPMSDRTAAALDRLSRRADFTSPTDYVAVDLDGDRIAGTALSRRVAAARDFAGLRPLTFHHLRHTFGSQAVAGGVDLVQVKDAMGHSKIETTEQYLHAKSRADVAAAFTAAQLAPPSPTAEGDRDDELENAPRNAVGARL